MVGVLLYGSGLGLMEALRLRVPELDFQMKSKNTVSGLGRVRPKVCVF